MTNYATLVKSLGCTPNANMADHSDGPGRVARKRSQGGQAFPCVLTLMNGCTCAFRGRYFRSLSCREITSNLKKRRTAILVKNASRSVDQLSRKRSSKWHILGQAWPPAWQPINGSRYIFILALILFKLDARPFAGQEIKFEVLNYMVIKTIVSKT